ncbi:hypothetical protein [Undibacterium sp. Xuan67W]|uniref:hypothetical protein n=1 Tax=Undibacterium sp. Xuan67W TaxID=3413057 RepID=UPI003BF0BC0D
MTNPSFDTILQTMYYKGIDNASTAKALKEQVKSGIDGILTFVDSFNNAVSSINQNGDLSTQGRASALLAQSTKSISALDALTKPLLASLNASMVSSTNALRKAASGADATLITELRAVEARAAFANIDNLNRPVRYIQLCESGEDDASCIAVENASQFAPLLDADTIELGRTVRGARSLPDMAQELHSAIELHTILAASAASAKRNMKLGKTLDPLQIAAMGGGYPIDDEGEDVPDALDAVNNAVSNIYS